MLFAAWRATGDGKFVEEIERLYRCCESDDSCSPEPGERVSSGGKGLYLPSLMMELDPWHHQRWRDMMRAHFARPLTPSCPMAPVIRRDGTTRRPARSYRLRRAGAAAPPALPAPGAIPASALAV